MKTPVLQILLVLLLMAMVMPVSAELKVAVVRVEQAIIDSEEAQGEIEKLTAVFKPEQDRLNALRDEIIALEDRAQKDIDILSQTEIADLRSEIEEKQLEFQFGSQRLQNDVNKAQENLMQKMGPKFNAVLNDLIELEGYDMVINYVPNLLLYVNTKHDITAKVTQLLDERKDENPFEESDSESDSE